MAISGWMDKEIVVYIHNGVYCSAIKKNASCHLRQHGWTLRVLSEISQKDKDKNCMISLTCGISTNNPTKSNQFTDTKNRLPEGKGVEDEWNGQMRSNVWWWVVTRRSLCNEHRCRIIILYTWNICFVPILSHLKKRKKSSANTKLGQGSFLHCTKEHRIGAKPEQLKSPHFSFCIWLFLKQEREDFVLF